ncbi:hypothetical protein HMP0721_2216 [Pseudoramibacter alactolyticus ATCC 23263]|uniref:Uncharacterized protein n=1 Tax=Pseudoramibacter alactolyticus ATCC 23263 TaxID=887929 RepID=E6MJN1_9FIRM|nr:hypothetical protein HMP0721_2216 [Pseudoramibacter alactolyticus ATCC 23263]
MQRRSAAVFDFVCSEHTKSRPPPYILLNKAGYEKILKNT